MLKCGHMTATSLLRLPNSSASPFRCAAFARLTINFPEMLLVMELENAFAACIPLGSSVALASSSMIGLL